MTIASDDLHFELIPLDNEDGTYYVEYTPTRVGEFELRSESAAAPSPLPSIRW